MRGVIVTFSVLLSIAATASHSSENWEERVIGGWDVSKGETPNDGLSCQALKCAPKSCSVEDPEAMFRLWGSQRRKAVTPMIGLAVKQSGARDARIVVGNEVFDLIHRPSSKGNLFIAKDPADDEKIMKAVARNRNGTIRFEAGNAKATFRLNGIGRVLTYFHRACGIPKP